MRSLLAATLTTIALAACGSDDHGDEEPVDCVKETSDDELLVGFTKPGELGVYDFKLVSFSPAPPARFLNEWTLEITSTASGAAPLAATQFIAMTPYMPQHGHGAGIDVEIEPMPTAGQFKFSSINLHMPGMWDVTVEVEPGAGAPTEDRVVFKPCIPN